MNKDNGRMLARIDERTLYMKNSIDSLFKIIDRKVDKKSFYWIVGIIFTFIISIIGFTWR